MLNPQDIRLLVVHCSNTPDKEDIGASEIHNMHLSFGWNGIGYHKIIRRDGQIESGRPEYWIGAHAKGKNAWGKRCTNKPPMEHPQLLQEERH